MRSRLLNAELHHHRHGFSARHLSDVINLQSNVARPDLQSSVARPYQFYWHTRYFLVSQPEVKWIEGSIEFCILRLPDIKVVLEPVVILILSSLIKLMRAARTCKWKQTHSSSTFSDFLWPILLNSLAHSAEKGNIASVSGP